MAKVTSKLQVTLPKALATQYRIRPGDDILWVASGDSIRVVPAREGGDQTSVAKRLAWFDQATARTRRKHKPKAANDGGAPRAPRSRGWTREGLYHRGRPR